MNDFSLLLRAMQEGFGQPVPSDAYLIDWEGLVSFLEIGSSALVDGTSARHEHGGSPS
jgi:hypothetical protein